MLEAWLAGGVTGRLGVLVAGAWARAMPAERTRLAASRNRTKAVVIGERMLLTILGGIRAACYRQTTVQAASGSTPQTPRRGIDCRERHEPSGMPKAAVGVPAGPIALRLMLSSCDWMTASPHPAVPAMPANPPRPLRVSCIHRLPVEGFYSIESYFQRTTESLQALGVEITNFTSPYPSQGVLPRLKIVRFARRHQGDITHISGDIHFAALGTDPTRTLVTVHDCGRLHQLRGIPREVLRQFWFQLPLRRLGAVTVISQAVKDDLLTWVPNLDPRRIQIVPVSISSAFRFSPQPFRPRNPRILQIGTAPNKNIARLAAALEGIEATLVVIGKLSPELEAVLARHRVRYENHRNLSESEVVELYRGADLLAFVSTLEGFGMPILEAQALGRPVVTSNCTSMPDVAGGAAVLVEPTSVESIRAGLLRVIGDGALRERLIAGGQRNIARFRSDAIAAQYLRIYQSLLQQSPLKPAQGNQR